MYKIWMHVSSAHIWVILNRSQILKAPSSHSSITLTLSFQHITTRTYPRLKSWQKVSVNITGILNLCCLPIMHTPWLSKILNFIADNLFHWTFNCLFPPLECEHLQIRTVTLLYFHHLAQFLTQTNYIFNYLLNFNKGWRVPGNQIERWTASTHVCVCKHTHTHHVIENN